MSGDRTSPRYDVVATTRRSWSKAQKQAIVAELDVGSCTLSQVARRHGIHASLLFRWRKTLGSVLGTPPTPATPTFIPVMLPAPSASAVAARAGNIEIVLVGGRTVRVDGEVDTVVLVRIVEALEKRR